MASPFSWADTVQIAFGSCMPCLRPTTGDDSSSEDQLNQNPAINRIPRARPDELQGLLADPDTDVEADAMSLHSNPGRGQRNRNKKKKKTTRKSSDKPHRITLFGYDLFGRPSAPPIYLPDDSEDSLYQRRRRTSTTPSAVVTTHSTASTFDSDAAPLDADAIAALSSPAAAESAAQASADAESQRVKEKEERRQRRREKKEMKRMAEMLAHGDGDGEDFEGFQGSGGQAQPPSKYPRMPNGMFSGSDSGSGSAFSGSGRGDGFGRFVSAPTTAPNPGPQISTSQAIDDEDDEAADLDGGLYSRKASRGTPHDGSDSRSRTSASMSDGAHQMPDPRNFLAHLQSQSQSSNSRINSPSRSSFQPHPDPTNKKKKSSKSSSSRTSNSNSKSTASESPSIASPMSPGFPSGPQEIVSPSTVEQGQGFFDLEDEAEVPNGKHTSAADFPSTRIGGGFPITGFGGGGARRTKDFGAFLARRGDESEAAEGL